MRGVYASRRTKLCATPPESPDLCDTFNACSISRSTLHSWLRWAALVAGLLATFTAFTSGASGKADRWGLLFMIVMDIQLLFGLALYLALSPTTAAIFGDFGAAMRDPVARFWAVEHVSLMLLAVVMAHLGRVLARKARTPEARRKRMLMCFTLVHGPDDRRHPVAGDARRPRALPA